MIIAKFFIFLVNQIRSYGLRTGFLASVDQYLYHFFGVSYLREKSLQQRILSFKKDLVLPALDAKLLRHSPPTECFEVFSKAFPLFDSDLASINQVHRLLIEYFQMHRSFLEFGQLLTNYSSKTVDAFILMHDKLRWCNSLEKKYLEVIIFRNDICRLDAFLRSTPTSCKVVTRKLFLDRLHELLQNRSSSTRSTQGIQYLPAINQRSVGVVKPSSRIALLGPAKIDDQDLLELDSYDYIAFIKPNEGYLTYYRNYFKRAALIAYFNHDFVKTYRLQTIKVTNIVDFAVFKSETDRQNIVHSLSEASKSWSTLEISPLIYFGAPLMGPIALFDLLYLEPSYIKIYGMSSYVSSPGMEYSSHYSFGRFRPSLKDAGQMRHSLQCHNILSNRNFLRFICNLFDIEADSDTKYSLGLGDHEFMRIIDGLY